MPRTCPTRIIIICDPGYDVLHIQNAVQQSSQEMQLERISASFDIHELPIDDADIVFLELSALHRLDIDPSELGDTLYSYIPVIFLGDEKYGQLALAGIRAGAQDWLLYEQIRNTPLVSIVENAQRSFLHQRNLVVNHARYQSVVEDQSELIYRCSPNYTVTFVNQAYANQLGTKANKLEETCVAYHDNLRDFDAYKRKLQSLSPEFPTAHHEECVHINGDIYWYSWADKGFFDSNGTLLEIQSIGTDVTARRCAEQEAIDGKKRFESIYDNAPVMMQELDSRGRILSVNQCWLEVMELRAKHVIGYHAFRFLEKHSRRAVVNAIQEFRRSGRVSNIPCRYTRGIHGPIEVLASATSNLWDENKNTRILVVSTELVLPTSPARSKRSKAHRAGFSRSVKTPEKTVMQH